ncbi:MAG: S41 family peptidase [Odoribacter sp.]|nr:S41 family peptidase [Odoribacter sp.]
MKTKRILFIAITAIVITCGLTALKNDDKSFEISKHLNIYATLFRDINMFYVDDTDPGDLVTTSIKAMLKSLDPYTVYYPESEMEDVKLMTTGEYAGIGSIISKKGDNIIIREPYKNSPAAKAGLLPGDVILSIDGNSTKGKSTDDVSTMLKGQPGKEITIKVQREYEEKPLEKKAIREKIQIPSVPFFGLANDSTGYIYLTSFTDKSANDVRSAIIELKNKGAKSMILDLRGNSGGLLDQAVEIVNYFVPKNSKVVSTKGKVKQWDKEYNADKNPIAPDMPLAVLIDRGSASASEIVSGALQDLDRAVLVGERSFGKGLVQTVRDLAYNTKLKVTTAKYYIPSGRCIQALDYSHRNPDGSVGKVPDSLITEYATQNGRKVYDGGGISPDIKIEAEEYAKITQELVIQDITFDFVNNYALRHPEIAPIKDFKLSDEVYNEFKQYLKEKNFSYETESQQMLEKLIKTAKNEKYFDASKQEIEKLQKEFAHSIDRDMNLFKEEIISFLTEQFIQRYYYQEGVLEYKMKHDKEIAKAVEILSDKAAYQKILKTQD